MMSLTRRKLLSMAAAGAAVPLGAFGQPARTRVRFSVDWVWQGNHSIWTLAADQGLFAAENLDAVLDRGYGSADNLTKLGAGSLDIALIDPNLLAKFNQENPGSQMVAVCIVYDEAKGAVISLKSAGIKSVKDLEGKKIAATESDATYLLFRALCKVNNVDINKIEIINVSPQLRDSLVIQKRADASIGFYSTAVLNIAAAGVPLADIDYLQYSKSGLPLYSLALICKKDYAAANPAVVSGFVRATVQGAQAVLKDPKAAIASLVRRDPLLKADLELQRLELVNKSSFLTTWVRQNGMSTVDRARFENTTGIVAEAFGLKSKPKIEDIYTDRFLPPAAERKMI